jgi:hypothetical protein
VFCRISCQIKMGWSHKSNAAFKIQKQIIQVPKGHRNNISYKLIFKGSPIFLLSCMYTLSQYVSQNKYG